MKNSVLVASSATSMAAVATAAVAFNPELWERIQAFDLSVVTKTFAERNSEYGAQADELEVEAKRFLYLAALVPDVELAPTKPIDEFWHQFILFTALYHRFSATFAGEYIQHDPLAGPRHPEIFAETQRLVREQFGDDFVGVTWWNLPMPATSCRCTNGRIRYDNTVQ